MIALGNLHLKNGLIKNAGVETLASGQDLIVDGNAEMEFGEGGGGMAVFLVLNLMSTQVA